MEKIQIRYSVFDNSYHVDEGGELISASQKLIKRWRRVQREWREAQDEMDEYFVVGSSDEAYAALGDAQHKRGGGHAISGGSGRESYCEGRTENRLSVIRGRL